MGHRNRLLNSKNSTNSLTPIYNGVGDRVGQTIGVSTTNYALDIGGGLPEVIYTSQSEIYLHLPGVIVTQKATEVRYLLSDGLGSIRHAVDETATVVAYQEFDPYGNPVAGEGDPYGYTGEWWEDAVGLLHLRARWYAPEMGTFLSVDPVESEPPYQYVRGNVVNWVDPTGNSPECQDDCVPTDKGYWQRKARISCLDLETHGPSMEQYLKWEATSDPPALLTRLAMGENNYDTLGGSKDRNYIMWIVKLRMEMGFTTWRQQDGTYKTTLTDEVFYPNQFSAVTGYAPNNVKGMVHVTDPYQAAVGKEAVVKGSACGGNINAGIYPCDDISEPDASALKSPTLNNWINTYRKARTIYYTSSEDFSQKFPVPLRGYESFAKAGQRQFFDLGNFYSDKSDFDEIQFGWPAP